MSRTLKVIITSIILTTVIIAGWFGYTFFAQTQSAAQVAQTTENIQDTPLAQAENAAIAVNEGESTKQANQKEEILGTIPTDEEWSSYPIWVHGYSDDEGRLAVTGFKDLTMFWCLQVPAEGCAPTFEEDGVVSVYFDGVNPAKAFKGVEAVTNASQEGGELAELTKLTQEKERQKQRKENQEFQNSLGPEYKKIQEEIEALDPSNEDDTQKRSDLLEKRTAYLEQLFAQSPLEEVIRTADDGKEYVKVEGYSLPFQPGFDRIDEDTLEIVSSTKDVYYIGTDITIDKTPGVSEVAYHIRNGREELTRFKTSLDNTFSDGKFSNVEFSHMLLSSDATKFGFLIGYHESHGGTQRGDSPQGCPLKEGAISPINKKIAPVSIQQGQCDMYSDTIYYDGEYSENYEEIQIRSIVITDDSEHILFQGKKKSADIANVIVLDLVEIETQGDVISGVELSEDQKSISYTEKRGETFYRIQRSLE